MVALLGNGPVMERLWLLASLPPALNSIGKDRWGLCPQFSSAYHQHRSSLRGFDKVAGLYRPSPRVVSASAPILIRLASVFSEIPVRWGCGNSRRYAAECSD